MLTEPPPATPGLDPHAAFDALIRHYVRPDTVALDAGADRGERYRYDYADIAAAVVGVDVDPAITTNARRSAPTWRRCRSRARRST